MSFLSGVVLAGTGAAGAALFACSNVSVDSVPTPDAAVGAPDAQIVYVTEPAADGAADAGDTCVHAVLPAASGGSSAASSTITMALTSFDIGQGDTSSATPIGFDLDGVCTGFKGPTADNGASSCVPAPGASVVATVDQAGGVDNVLAQLVAASQGFIPGAGGLAGNPTAARIATGVQTLLVRISGYDGSLNSMPVEVNILISGELETTLDCDAGTFVLPDAAPIVEADGASTGPSPKNDGCDIWSVNSASLGPDLGSGTVTRAPVFTSTSAYVTNGRLVATFEQLSLPLGVSIVQATGISLLATISGGGGNGVPYQLTNGVVAGRVSATELLNSFKPLALTAGGPGLCPGNLLYDDGLKPQICNDRDLASDPAQPFTAPCEALSFAGAITAIETRREGDVVDAGLMAPIASNCDAALDTCGN